MTESKYRVRYSNANDAESKILLDANAKAGWDEVVSFNVTYNDYGSPRNYVFLLTRSAADNEMVP